MSRRRSATWLDHLERQVRRNLHVAHLMIRDGDNVAALAALHVALEHLEQLARIKAEVA